MKYYFFLLICVGFAIDASDYIWFQFGQETPIQSYSSSYSQVVLPCHTRIATCQYNFTIVPLNWKSQNNKLLIPVADAAKTANYAVKVIVSDVTGETLEFSLILEIDSGRIKTFQRQKYFRDIGLDDPQGELYIPPSFPEIQQIQTVLAKADIFQITTLISNLLATQAPCKDEIKYLETVSSIFKEKEIQKKDQIQILKAEILARRSKIDNLKSDKNKLEQQINSDNRIKELEVDISKLNQTQFQTNLTYNRFNTIAKELLTKIEDVGETKIAPTSGELDKKRAEMDKLNMKIKQLVQRKRSIEEEVVQNKLDFVEDYNKLVSDTLEHQYKYYAQLELQQKIKYEQLEFDIKELESQVRLKRGVERLGEEEIEKIIQQIEELDKEKQNNSDRSLKNAKTILESNSQNVKIKVDEFKKQCE